jgi:death-on-curing protein
MSADPIEPIWLTLDLALAIHDRQLAEHGGLSGVRDQAGLESALARPINKWSYGETDMSALAAAYAFGVARNHPFGDGNKRTAWVLANLFLQSNGELLVFTREDAIRVVMDLAAGNVTEEALAEWFRKRLTATP